MINQRAKSFTSVAYLLLIVIYFTFSIATILDINGVLPTIITTYSDNGYHQLSPVMLVLELLFTGYFIAMLITGKKMELKGIGYAGLVMMIFTSLYRFAVSIMPVYLMLADSLSYETASLVFSTIWWIIVFIEMTGMLLFLLGTCVSTAMKILTPGYVLFSFILSLGMFPLLRAIGDFEYQTIYTINSILCIAYIGGALLTPYLLWRKK